MNRRFVTAERAVMVRGERNKKICAAEHDAHALGRGIFRAMCAADCSFEHALLGLVHLRSMLGAVLLRLTKGKRLVSEYLSAVLSAYRAK